jgi:hypothetical protein
VLFIIYVCIQRPRVLNAPSLAANSLLALRSMAGQLARWSHLGRQMHLTHHDLVFNGLRHYAQAASCIDRHRIDNPIEADTEANDLY